MEVGRRRRTFGNLGFFLAVGAAAAVPFWLVVGAAVALSRQPAPVAFMVVLSVVMLAIPVLSLTGILAGHLARHSRWRTGRTTYALVVAYWTLAGMVILTLLSVLLFILVRS